MRYAFPSTLRLLLTSSLATSLSCSLFTAPGDQPAGLADTDQPFPLDRASAAGEPATYKGLPLRLTDTGAPAVTAVDGLVGVVCVGMSNANQECADFIGRVTTEYAAAVDPSVRVVNCAVGGHAIERWIDTLYDATLWDDCVARKLPAAGLRLDQVRVLYHKAADQFTTGAGGAALPVYPAAGSDYENFGRNLDAFAGRVRAKFPAVQAVYTSSRSYGGFAGSAGRGEPLSYEEGHALNGWLRDHAAVEGVWYGWGPYLWAPACGGGPTNGGGVCYDRADYVSDGVHPSASGTAKMSALLHARLLREAWYRR
ncbi:MAG: hypothetical protein OEW77_04125 [Gemmatimonadota bacterium]|nr:hypothetical protein [Gemmatimonadota bacterium]